ncbi:unnamed protein product [Rhizophagus irregularis]|nr:unnamed protein product [Rhizophagus irregularis]
MSLLRKKRRNIKNGSTFLQGVQSAVVKCGGSSCEKRVTKLSYVGCRIKDIVPKRLKSEIRDVLREVNAENKKQ